MSTPTSEVQPTPPTTIVNRINNPTVLTQTDEFDRILIELKALHDKKKNDYSASSNRFSNFEYAANSAGIDTYQTFEVLLGVKQSRLIELRTNNKTPNNESIRDTLIDRVIYSILALAYYDKENQK